MSYSSEVLADAPNAWYRQRETAAPIADSSGNGAPDSSVTSGTPTYGIAGPIISDGAASKGISYDGADDYFNIPDDALFDVGDVLTLEVWLKRNETASTYQQKILSKLVPAYLIYLENHQFGFGKAETAVIVLSTTTIQDLLWHHLVLTKNGATVKQYIDGVDVTGTVTNATLGDGTGALWIAAEAGFWDLDGVLSEIAIYPTALSQARVQAHYAEAIAAGATLPDIQSRVPMPMMRVPDQDRIMRMHGRTLGS